MGRELTITLTDEEARLIEERVHSGAFASASEVVKAGLASIVEAEERERLETEWLRKKVQEALDDPRPSVPADDVQQHIQQWYDEALHRHAKS